MLLSKVCVLKRVKDGLRIHHMVKKHYKEELLSDGNIVDPVFIAQELKKIIGESQIRTKAVACALSSYTIITKKIVAPFVEEDELENTIRLEVEAVIPFPLKDIYYSYYVLGVDPDQEDMMHSRAGSGLRGLERSRYIARRSASGASRG